jgi:hypothetical protein
MPELAEYTVKVNGRDVRMLLSEEDAAAYGAQAVAPLRKAAPAPATKRAPAPQNKSAD